MHNACFSSTHLVDEISYLMLASLLSCRLFSSFLWKGKEKQVLQKIKENIPS